MDFLFVSYDVFSFGRLGKKCGRSCMCGGYIEFKYSNIELTLEKEKSNFNLNAIYGYIYKLHVNNLCYFSSRLIPPMLQLLKRKRICGRHDILITV